MSTFTLIKRLASVVLIAWIAQGSIANATLINAVETGWYDDAGNHMPGNENYAVGWGELDFDVFGELRNFFVFDLSGVGQVTSAVLRAYQTDTGLEHPPGYASDDPSETWSLFDVSTDVADIIAGTGGIAAFNDFASGTAYGSQAVTTADNGSFVEVVLNADTLTSLSGADGLWAIGGALSTLSRLPEDEAIFGWSDFDPRVELLITTSSPVPAPAPMLLITMGIVGLVWSRRGRC